MKVILPFIFLFSVIWSTQCTAQMSSASKPSNRVYSGLEVAEAQNFAMLKGKRVGLITNPTGVNYYLESTVDILHEHPEVNLVALYGPEHGVRGDYSAGDKVGTETDAKTGLTAYSLYGSTRKPTAEMLENIDVLVFDIQDIGSRSYTYISTLGLAMEAAAEFKKEVVVFDRPNPLGGEKMEGNLVEPGFESFVGQYAIPYVHGLTVGEFAQFLNGEVLETPCSLTVVSMKNWKRSMNFSATGLPWVPTSPHIPHAESPEFYTSTGVLGELGVVSEGVGYTLPFQVYAAEWIDGAALAEKMNALELEGVLFRPITFKPYYAKHSGKRISGVQIHFTDYRKVNLLELQFYFMEVHHELYPEKNPFKLAQENRLSMFDKVMGTDKIRLTFSETMKVESIKSMLRGDIEAFRKLASPYFLYE